MEEKRLRNYARVLLETGVHLQSNQVLVINADVENHEFVSLVTQEAYALGAKDVQVNWRSHRVGRERLLHVSKEILKEPGAWIRAFYQAQVQEGAAFLSLISANPHSLQGVPSDKIATSSRSLSQMLRFYHEKIMDSTLTWCVAAVATETWANVLELPGTREEKVDALWDLILTLSRVEAADEAERIQPHLERLAGRTQTLNASQLVSLHYQAANGTDLTIGLPKGHLWQGGAEYSKSGILFDANIPTEEVFSAPDRLAVNGIVYSTKPLIHHGNVIQDFSLTFRDGRIVAYDAKEGLDILREIIETDEGSHYLGEVALVDHYSPISQSQRVYWETLFDENASCHLAIGASYPTCLADSDGLSTEELKERGLNDSLVHVDFMIGHESLCITGRTADGQAVPIMDQGRLVV